MFCNILTIYVRFALQEKIFFCSANRRLVHYHCQYGIASMVMAMVIGNIADGSWRAIVKTSVIAQTSTTTPIVSIRTRVVAESNWVFISLRGRANTTHIE